MNLSVKAFYWNVQKNRKHYLLTGPNRSCQHVQRFKYLTLLYTAPLSNQGTVDEIYVSFLLLCDDYRCLIIYREKSWQSTSCCGQLTHHIDQQHLNFCRTPGHRITLWWMILLVIFLSLLKRCTVFTCTLLQRMTKKVEQIERGFPNNWKVFYDFSEVCKVRL